MCDFKGLRVIIWEIIYLWLIFCWQVMPLPTLASLEQDAARVKRLQEENESLRHKIVALMELPGAANVISAMITSAAVSSNNSGPGGVAVGLSSTSSSQGISIQDIVPPEVPQPPDLMDDFYVIAP